MTLSKKSINNFANQYNIAVSTKSLSFSVEATLVNLEVLKLFKEAGLIRNYYFEPFDPIHTQETKKKLKPFVNLEHKWVDNKTHFFDFQEFGSILSDQVPYVRDTIMPETYRIWQDKYSYTEDFTKSGLIEKLNDVDLSDYDYKFFLIDVLDLLKKMKNEQNIKTGDLCYFINHSEHIKIISNKLDSLMINDKWFSVDKNWSSFMQTIKKLYKNYSRKVFGNVPSYVIFDEEYIQKLEKYILYIKQYTPLRLESHDSRITMPLLIPDDNANLTKVFYDNSRITVFPKYDKSIPGIRKILTCGGTQVWRHVSYNYLRQLCNTDGFNTFYLISTSNGLTLTTLDWILSQQGGLLVLKIDT